jgi:DNA (cytosine-5)-methyltransferase 1
VRVVGLFAGIGGIEEGLRQAGHHAIALCEVDEAARAVLRVRFPQVPIDPDIRLMQSLPDADIVTAGFPCQDLSQAGTKSGITGSRSGLIRHIFRLLRAKRPRPEWLFIENVSYMIRLDRGAAMRYLTEEISALGYRWAYRVTDARSFGIPQRRQRVLLVASRTDDPARVLFGEDHRPPDDLDQIKPIEKGSWYGFYWTEGRRGIGWTTEGVPTVKGGSTLGIASPPAVWIPSLDFVGTPSIEDVERLQGFPPGWTSAASRVTDGLKGSRWRLVGNAVCVPMARWVGKHLIHPNESVTLTKTHLNSFSRWPLAATGYRDKAYAIEASMWPLIPKYTLLRDFLKRDLAPLSVRATEGFLTRASDSIIRYPDGFLSSVQTHLRRVRSIKPVN